MSLAEGDATTRKIAPIHPEAQRVQDIIAELEKGVVPPVPIPEMRALMKKRTARLAAEPPTVARIVNQTIEGVPVRIYYPKEPAPGALLPAYVYAHGGGFVVGDLDVLGSPQFLNCLARHSVARRCASAIGCVFHWRWTMPSPTSSSRPC